MQCYDNSETEAVLLFDATNAFSCMNRQAALRVLCLTFYQILQNTYRSDFRMIIPFGGKILLPEGTTQNRGIF